MGKLDGKVAVITGATSGMALQDVDAVAGAAGYFGGIDAALSHSDRQAWCR